MPFRSAPPARSYRPFARSTLQAILAVFAAILLAGCAVAASASPESPTAGPTSADATGSAPGTASPAGSSGGPSLPTQTDTAWGRIWDELPAAFPRHPGAAAATVSRDPVTAEFTVSGDAAAVLAALRAALEAAGYRTVSLAGPLEDGSRTLESTGATAGCRVRTTVGPLGGQTHIAVLFGAACPFR